MMKFRLFFMLVLLASAAFPMSAQGIYEISNARPIANCGTSGDILSYDYQLVEFEGGYNYLVSINGVDVIAGGGFSAGSPITTSGTGTISAFGLENPSPNNSVYRLQYYVNGELILDISWRCNNGKILNH